MKEFQDQISLDEKQKLPELQTPFRLVKKVKIKLFSNNKNKKQPVGAQKIYTYFEHFPEFFQLSDINIFSPI